MERRGGGRETGKEVGRETVCVCEGNVNTSDNYKYL